MLAALPGGFHARARAFADEITLELGQRPHDMKDQLTAVGRGVYAIGETLEAYPAFP